MISNVAENVQKLSDKFLWRNKQPQVSVVYKNMHLLL